MQTGIGMMRVVAGAAGLGACRQAHTAGSCQSSCQAARGHHRPSWECRQDHLGQACHHDSQVHPGLLLHRRAESSPRMWVAEATSTHAEGPQGMSQLMTMLCACVACLEWTMRSEAGRGWGGLRAGKGLRPFTERHPCTEWLPMANSALCCCRGDPVSLYIDSTGGIGNLLLLYAFPCYSPESGLSDV